MAIVNSHKFITNQVMKIINLIWSEIKRGNGWWISIKPDKQEIEIFYRWICITLTPKEDRNEVVNIHELYHIPLKRFRFLKDVERVIAYKSLDTPKFLYLHSISGDYNIADDFIRDMPLDKTFDEDMKPRVVSTLFWDEELPPVLPVSTTKIIFDKILLILSEYAQYNIDKKHISWVWEIDLYNYHIFMATPALIYW